MRYFEFSGSRGRIARIDCGTRALAVELAETRGWVLLGEASPLYHLRKGVKFALMAWWNDFRYTLWGTWG